MMLAWSPGICYLQEQYITLHFVSKKAELVIGHKHMTLFLEQKVPLKHDYVQ